MFDADRYGVTVGAVQLEREAALRAGLSPAQVERLEEYLRCREWAGINLSDAQVRALVLEESGESTN